jgi:hypothetical protein
MTRGGGKKKSEWTDLFEYVDHGGDVCGSERDRAAVAHRARVLLDVREPSQERLVEPPTDAGALIEHIDCSWV